MTSTWHVHSKSSNLLLITRISPLLDTTFDNNISQGLIRTRSTVRKKLIHNRLILRSFWYIWYHFNLLNLSWRWVNGSDIMEVVLQKTFATFSKAYILECTMTLTKPLVQQEVISEWNCVCWVCIKHSRRKEVPSAYAQGEAFSLF